MMIERPQNVRRARAIFFGARNRNLIAAIGQRDIQSLFNARKIFAMLAI
jgi:hypothetical protein